MSTVSDLPDDIVVALAMQLKQQSITSNDLLHFILVCKRWHQIGHRVLYRNIGLGNTTIRRFADSFRAEEFGDRVRSLSVRIEEDPSVKSGYRSIPSYESSLPERLASLVPVISQCTNLASFSLRSEHYVGRMLPRATIVAMLDSLPGTCQYLELDTRGQDQREKDEKAHVCDAIRRLLPRLQHARIRIEAMCSAMFDSDECGLINLPNLKSLMINYSRPDGLQMQLCGPRDWTHPARKESSAVAAMNEALVGLAHGNKEARVFAVLGVAGDFESTYQTILRFDFAEKKTWAFPCINIGTDFCSFLMRLHNDDEIVLDTLEDFEEVAKGQIWRTAIGDIRLPADVLEAEDSCTASLLSDTPFEQWSQERRIRITIGDMPFEEWEWDPDTCVVLNAPGPITFAEWTEADRDEQVPKLFRNEELAGMKLVRAEIRTGDGWLDVRPVRELTLDGWTKDGEGLLHQV